MQLYILNEEEEKRLEEIKTFLSRNYYSQSETMRILSHQCLNNGLNDNPEKIAELDELIKATGKINGCPESWMDFYALGVIHGKQAERRKQKSK